MKKFNLFYSSIILGLIWGFWHFPAYLIGTGVPLEMNFMVFLLWVSRKFQDRIRTGNLFLIYLIFYGIGRVGLEYLRLDISSFQGININQAFMAAVVLASGVLFILRQNNKPVESIIQ